MSRRLVEPLAVAAVAALYFASFLTYGVQLEDEGLILFQIASAAHGQFPYVDFHTGYTPGLFYFNAALFRLFGESVVPLRAVVAVVNAALVGLLYALARPIAGRALAAAAALGYAAFLPFFVGQFASFNIPYPGWYAGLAFVAAQAALHRHVAGGSRTALVVAGLATAVAFAFKPNAGVLAGFACGLSLAILAAGSRGLDRRSAAALLVVAALALVALVGEDVVSWEGPMLLGAPLLLVIGRLVWARADGAAPIRLWPAVGLLLLGSVLPTVPWLVYFAHRLGPRFVQEVFLVGSGAERVYGISYPVEITFPAAGPLLAGLVIVAVGALGLAVESGLVRRRRALVATGAMVIAFVALGRLFFRMPEGVGAAIVMQVLHIPFYAAPPLALGTAAFLLHRGRAAGASLGPSERWLVVALVFAVSMYLMLYPRIDTMHLVFALPSMLVLAAAATARSARAWATVLGVPARALRAGAAGVAAVLIVVSVARNATGLVTIEAGTLARRAQVTLVTPHAPVHVEAARADDFRALNGVFRHLDGRLPPGATLFAFPALAFIPYGLGCWTPSPHNYYFPGRPDHRAEVEVVRRLEAVRPPYAVTLNRRLGFFSQAPMYYFVLRPYLEDHYVLDARFGRYDVLRRRRGDEPAGPTPQLPVAPSGPAERDAVFARLADPDRDIRRDATAAFLARAGTREGVTALASAWAPDEGSRLLLVRNLGEAGDDRAVDFLAATYDSAGIRLRHEAANALTYIAARETTDRYVIAADGTRPPARALVPRVGVTTERMRDWMASSGQRRWIGIYAARALAEAGDVASVPQLEATLHDERRRPYLQVAAATALVVLGRLDHLVSLVDLLAVRKHDVQDWVPAFLIEQAAPHPAEVAASLRHGLGHFDPLVRETSAWVAGAAGLTSVAPDLRRALGDPAAEVRVAAVWALGVLRDRDARPTIARLVDGGDPEVQPFAAEALARLDGARS